MAGYRVLFVKKTKKAFEREGILGGLMVGSLSTKRELENVFV